MDGASSFEECFEHRAWVRALAERLCAHAGDAADVEQDTWVVAARGGAAARSTRPWLGGVVRHLAWRQQLRSSARAERERAAARPEAVPSSDALLARAELQRRVLSAVAELDEAQRVVVLMHHYEGCDGAEIARRLGLSGSTVRSRLARAHARLRAKLDAEYGGERAAWSALLAPAVLIDSGAGATSVGVAVAMKVQLVVVAAIGVTLAVVLWPERAPERVAREPALALEGSVDAPRPVADGATSGAVVAIEEQRTVAPASAPPVEHVLVFGDLHGLDDGPPPGGQLTFVDENGTSRTGTPGARGTYSIFGLKPGAYRVTSWLRGYAPLDEELLIPPGEEKVRHDFTLTRALVLPVRFIDRATGEPFDAAPGRLRSGLAAIATRERPLRVEGVFGRAPRATDAGSWSEASSFGPAPRAAELEVWEAPPVYVSCVLRDVVLESRLLHGNETELVFELDRARVEEALATLTLRCIDGATGEAVEPQQVLLGVADGGCFGKNTVVDGVTTITELAPGWRQLTVHAGGYAAIRRWMHFAPGARIELDALELRPAARLRGRVVDADGEGVSVRLLAHSLETTATPRDLGSGSAHQSASDGSFELHGLEAGDVRIVAYGADWAWGVLDVDARGGEVEGLELELERGTEVWLRPPRGGRSSIEALLADGTGGVLGAIRLRRGAGEVLRLAPGAYELQLVADNAVVGRQGFQVGAERVVVEVALP